MAEKPDGQGKQYFMVSVEEAVSVSYPVAAASEEDARRMVSDLIATKRLRGPRSIVSADAQSRIDVKDPVESSSLMCGRSARELFTPEEAELLLSASVSKVATNLNPEEMSRAAKISLQRSGSGALQPSRRQRI